ncbi:MAG: tripartite tricarboxylate transporter substrate binding protein, partial [Betaproteobacteria bacterium]|nr:tripartite tricarboxylate transporter substrate binding protein [Betaproteobacteria bacterium]
IDLARTNKGGLNFSGAGVGSLGHLAAELFKSVTKAPMEHVAYKGGGPAISALIGNEVHFYFSTLPAALVQTRAGRLRALGVTSSKRSAAAPQVPTIAEQGFPGFEVVGWVGMFAPAATPASAINLLNGNMNKVLKLPEIKERLLTDGMEPAGGTPKDFATQVGQDLRKWNAVVKQAGVKPE